MERTGRERAFNRTSMELKRDMVWDYEISGRLLIEPAWN